MEYRVNELMLDFFTETISESYPDGLMRHDDFLMPYIFLCIFLHVAIGLMVYFL